jgi:hypothetical protein
MCYKLVVCIPTTKWFGPLPKHFSRDIPIKVVWLRRSSGVGKGPNHFKIGIYWFPVIYGGYDPFALKDEEPSLISPIEMPLICSTLKSFFDLNGVANLSPVNYCF